MGEKKMNRKYMNFDEFRAEFADWSYSTLVRRIKNDGFPAVKDGGGFLIPRAEAEAWFKKRTVAGQ